MMRVGRGKLYGATPQGDLTGRNVSDAACAFPEGGCAEGGLAGLVGICRRQRVCICRLRRELEIIKKAIVTPFFLLAILYGPCCTGTST